MGFDFSDNGRGPRAIVRARAPAKLNLGLELLARRPDGYHELVSVVQCINLCDVVGAMLEDSISLDAPPSTGRVERNLVWRAAVRLRERARGNPGALMVLTKLIPVGAGLGGGSSDGAATLRVLCRLWNVALRPGELRRIAAELGSDVPLFLRGTTSLVQGRGERVTRLPPLRSGWFVLVVPPWDMANKTASVYAAVRSEDFSGGTRTHELADALRGRQPIDQTLFVNALEPAACRVFEYLEPFWQQLDRATGATFRVSGAGPALFHYFATREEAKRCAKRAARHAAFVQVVRPRTRLPPVQPLSRVLRAEG